MNRRRFLHGGCAACAALLPLAVRAEEPWQPPARFVRPDAATDEGGLWAIMDRQEARLKRSPFELRDPALTGYLQDLACRLAGEHCPEVRVHVVHTPWFNASMAPNGMLQVWTGLLLRVENEAQLAAVIGHEIGHYLSRHSLEQLRDARSKSAFAQFFGLFGVVGLVGAVALAASAFSYTREHEREADRISLVLMRQAGYDPAEAARVWANLLKELEVRQGGDPAQSSPMFATHPAIAERQETLARLAAEAPGGETREAEYLARILPFRLEWLHDEIKRGQHEESIALFGRMIASWPTRAELPYARGETYRKRASDGDLDLAVQDLLAAVALGGEPPQTHRSLGLIYRQRGQTSEAAAALQRYIEVAPDAPDLPLIKSYLEEIKT